MAKGWKAKIRVTDGFKTVFAPGDLVAGFTKDQMARLWEAGALEEAEVADSSFEGSDTPPPPVTVETSGGTSTGTEGAGTPPTEETGSESSSQGGDTEEGSGAD